MRAIGEISSIIDTDDFSSIQFAATFIRDSITNLNEEFKSGEHRNESSKSCSVIYLPFVDFW